MCIVCGSGSAHLLRAIARTHAAPRPSASRFVAHVVAPPVMPPLDPASEADLSGPADVILRGGPILTMSAATPSAEAVAVRAGRIQAVGSEAAAYAHRGRLTRIVDLRGRALLPGFVNAHWHLPFTLLCEWVDATGADSPAAALAALAEAARGAAPGEWLVLGVSAGMAPAGAAVLDAAAPTHPAVVADPDGAILAANTLAAAAGEGAAHISALVPRLAARFAGSAEPTQRRLTALLRQTAALGVTCLRVCGLGTLSGANDLDLLRAVAEPSPPLRLRATLDAALHQEWSALRLSPGFGDDAFRVDTLSIWFDPDAGAAPRLGADLRRARDAGWGVTVHANDDAQVEQALAAFAGSGAAFDRRCGLECRRAPLAAQTVALDGLGLSLGLTASHDPVPMDNAPSGGLSGVPVSLGLDAATGPSAPLRMVRNAEAGEFGVALAPVQALAAVTIDAAHRCGAGDILGSIERGKYADFAFLDSDPRGAGDYAAPRCVGTWVNGLEAFRA